jgi:2',3'-cyclic-nucleotide 2'-phosphodiesterase
MGDENQRKRLISSHFLTGECRFTYLCVKESYMTGAGTTGDYDSVIGMEKEEPVRRFTTKLPATRFEPAMGPATLCGVAVGINDKGLALQIAPVRIGGCLAEARPAF